MEDNARTGELRRKLEKDPGSRLFAQLAEELRKDGKLEEAISVASKGLEKNPNYPSARLTLARALLDLGRPKEARPELEQIVKTSPDNIMASRLLGEALESLGQLDQAMQQFEKTLVFAPGDKAVTERITLLKAKRAAPLLPTVPPVPLAPPTIPPAAPVPPPAAAAAPLPSVFGDAPAASPLPSVFSDAPVAVPVPSVFDAPAPAPAPPPVPSPPAGPGVAPAPSAVALDRDLASGTFSPGSLNAADLQKHFEETAASEAPTRVETAAPFVAEPASIAEPEPPVAPSLPVVEMPAEQTDLGAQTLPLTSVTLADLYLQQGLKAEASAVLSQVMKEEPDNLQAKSKFAAVSSAIAAEAPRTAAPPPVPYRSARARARDRTIASLRLFASAAEREALNQRATERGVI